MSKLAAEHYVRTLGKLHGVETITLRYFNVFGPGQDPASEYAAVVPRFVTAVLEGRQPTIFGVGDVSRDFTYVDNVVNANMLAAQASSRSGITCNIAVATANIAGAPRHDLPGGRPPSRSHLRAAATRRHRSLARGISFAERELGYTAPCRSTKGSPARSPGIATLPRSVTEGIPAGLPDGTSPARGIASVSRPLGCDPDGSHTAVQVLGIVRELFLAAQVGISADFDAVLIGLVLPATLSSVLTAGISTALVPAYIDARSSHGIAGAKRLAGTVLVWVAIFGLLVTVALEVFAPATVRFTGPGLSPVGREQAVDYLRLVAPTTMVAGAFGILYAVCQAEEQFSSIAWSILAGPAWTVAIMFALWDRLGLGAFALGPSIGPFVSFLLLLVAMIRRKVAPRPHLLSRGLGVGALARHAFPLTISSAILQINVIFDRAVASLIAPGAVSALRYGDTLVRVPTGAISPAWGAAIYPALVRSHQDESGLAVSADRSLRYVLAIFVPVSALTLAVAPVAASTAYGRGAFTPEDLP